MNLDTWAETSWELLPVRKKTLDAYKSCYKCQISAKLGHLPLDDISRRDVQGFILGTSPSIGEKALVVLKTLFREACIYNVTDNNPTIGIRKKPVTRKPRPFMTWDELKNNDYGKRNDLFRFMALHGVRWSEVQALTPSDFLGDYVSINKSIYGPTKNTQSRRIPYMGHWDPNFPKSYKWCYEAIQPYSIHSLRKTYAYSLKMAGVHVQVAQRLLGHSSIAITYDLYTEVLPEEVGDAGDLLRLAGFSSTL